MNKLLPFLVFSILLLIPVGAQDAFGIVLTFNNPTLSSGFGFSVSISGNNVLVGSPRDNTGAPTAGSAYLFDATGNLLQTFNNPTPAFQDGFGRSVSISGNNVLVGAGFAESAYLFDATTGNLLQTFNNPTPEDFDRFGHSVSISGNNVLVGAPSDDTGATDAGSAYLFDTTGNLLQTFNNPTPEEFETFGDSVSISGNNVLVGVPSDDTEASNTGSAYLFDTTGNLLQRINNPTPESGDSFGFSVSISGNNVLVGAAGDNTGATDAGSAYLFDTTGNLLQTFNNPIPASQDSFGFSVSISGNNVLVGVFRDDTGATDAGSAYLFDTTGNLLQIFNNPNPAESDKFGASVSIDGDNVLVGAEFASNRGSAYLFIDLTCGPGTTQQGFQCDPDVTQSQLDAALATIIDLEAIVTQLTTELDQALAAVPNALAQRDAILTTLFEFLRIFDPNFP